MVFRICFFQRSAIVRLALSLSSSLTMGSRCHGNCLVKLNKALFYPDTKAKSVCLVGNRRKHTLLEKGRDELTGLLPKEHQSIRTSSPPILAMSSCVRPESSSKAPTDGGQGGLGTFLHAYLSILQVLEFKLREHPRLPGDDIQNLACSNTMDGKLQWNSLM